MSQIKFSDWQEFSLKKDVEKIAKEVKKEKRAIYCIIWEALVFFFTFSLDHIFEISLNEECINKLYLIGLSLAASPLLIAIIIAIIKFIAILISAKKGLVPTEEYVDNFDNRICYWIMISRSYNGMIENTTNVSEVIFYYQESSYYVNKAIIELYKMSPIITKVFSDDITKVKRNKVISISRLNNVLQLITASKPSAEIFERNGSIEIKINNKFYNGENRHKKIIQFQIEIDKKYRKDLKIFLERAKNAFPSVDVESP